MGEYDIDASWRKLVEGEPMYTGFPRFYHEQVEDPENSKNGVTVYKNVEMVEIHQPGDRLNVPTLEVTDEIRAAYPKHYEAFLSGIEEVEIEGTPLEMWPQINAAQARTLKTQQVHSVDQLAEVPDAVLQDLGHGMVRLRQKARDWVEVRDGSASMVGMKEQIAELERRLEMLAEKNEELTEENMELAANQKKRPGRKPKAG